MELSVSAETGDRAWRFDTPLYRMTVDGKRIVTAEQNGMTFWYCDGLVYLDNGRAWTVGNVMPDHTALLEDAVALFRASEITVFERPGDEKKSSPGRSASVPPDRRMDREPTGHPAPHYPAVMNPETGA